MRKWGSWVAEVRFPNSRERLWLGSYPTPEQAARASDAAVYCLRGPGAALNFPDQPPHIPLARTLSREEIRAAAVRFAHDEPRRTEEAQGGGEERRRTREQWRSRWRSSRGFTSQEYRGGGMRRKRMLGLLLLSMTFIDHHLSGTFEALSTDVNVDIFIVFGCI
ncbi:AP2 [Musa troglodytarum]|uniref:AP2 n=1 Tax=Musa troglodytarum TaxID=320322 RepID=A0A9E7F503_9LILI|nr:AP2 [Musa troglodytarum]